MPLSTVLAVCIPEDLYFFFSAWEQPILLFCTVPVLDLSSVTCGLSWKLLTETREKGNYLKIFARG